MLKQIGETFSKAAGNLSSSPPTFFPFAERLRSKNGRGQLCTPGEPLRCPWPCAIFRPKLRTRGEPLRCPWPCAIMTTILRATQLSRP